MGWDGRTSMMEKTTSEPNTIGWPTLKRRSIPIVDEVPSAIIENLK
jgi:hypothetical protein